MDALGTRWPGWQPRLAAFLMTDPLRQMRDTLQQLHRQAIMPRSQGDQFAVPAAPPESPA
ncbi:hypothetical protein, partial [Roseateles sp. P5_E1]